MGECTTTRVQESRAKMKQMTVTAVLALLAWTGVDLARAAEPLPMCDDGAGWPPYTFVDPRKPDQIIGASMDLLLGILVRAGYDPQLTLLPWKRCLAEVEAGKMAMLLNATHSEERAQKFLMSKPYYAVHSVLYYRSYKYPVPPKMATVADMKAYRYCGLFGYNYSMYDIPQAQLDTGAKDEISRFEMLRMGRCDFVLGDLEILNAFSAMGKINLSGTGYIPIPEAKPKEFHVMVSRMWGGGPKLLKVIDEGIAVSKADKTYAKVFAKYGL